MKRSTGCECVLLTVEPRVGRPKRRARRLLDLLKVDEMHEALHFEGARGVCIFMHGHTRERATALARILNWLERNLGR